MSDMESAKIARGALIAALVSIWVSAAYSLYEEVLPFLSNQLTAAERVDAAEGAALKVGLSSYSHDMALMDCKTALMSPVSRLVMAEKGLAGARSCASTAAASLRLTPTNGFAAFVGAYADAMLGKASSSQQLLALSRALAPSEGWLASLRLRMIRQNMPSMGNRMNNEEDIRVLGTIPEGRSYLAEWYVLDLASRDAISEAVSHLSDADQKSFLDLVKMFANHSSTP